MSRLQFVCLLALSGTLLACASTSESVSADTLTANVGRYAPPPSNITRPRVGIPSFTVSGAQAKAEMNNVAADQISTLLVQSQRFSVIERAQMDKLIAEQNLSNVVRNGELAAAGEIRGVDYLLLGKVTNLRTKVARTKRGFGLGKLGGFIGVGAGDYEKEDVEITTECGVDLRLVSPESGEVAVANFSEFKRKDKASAVGVEILGFNADANADLSISNDDYGKILRLALDDAVRKMLPSVDQFLVNQN